MADGGDGLPALREVPDDLEHARVEPQVFGRAAAGDHERVVVPLLDLLERGVELEVVAAFLGIRLVALEVVHGRAHGLTRRLARAHRVHGVSHGLQRLEGHHHLVVLHEVPDEHQYLPGHESLPRARPASPAALVSHPRS